MSLTCSSMSVGLHLPFVFANLIFWHAIERVRLVVGLVDYGVVLVVSLDDSFRRSTDNNHGIRGTAHMTILQEIVSLDG